MRKLLYFFSLLSHLSFSQPFSGKITGNVSDDAQKVLEFATVTLHQANDSTFVKASLSDEKGSFEFENIAEGVFFIKIAYAGYQKFKSPVFQLNALSPTIHLAEIQLKTATKTLNEVTVRGTRPFIERTLDKVIVNVENSIVSAGATAIEVLERSPSVFVDNDGRIRFKGRSGVIVMIDGKPSPLAGADLGNYLKGLPSNAIEKIELIANPSAKYDASGNAGIINIKLKKDKNLGTNGSITASAGYGRYEKLSAALTLNYRNRNVNIFGGLNSSRNRNFNNLILNRKFSNNGVVEAVFLQNNDIAFPSQNLVPRIGADFFVSKKTTIGVVATGFASAFGLVGSNVTDVLNGNNQKTSRFTTENDTQTSWLSGSGNVNFKHIIDSTGKELTADFDFAQYNNTSDQLFITDYFNASDVLLRQNTLIGDVLGNLSLKSFKIDYVNPIGKKARLEAGAKTSFVQNDNNLQFFDRVDAQNVFNKNLSNHFVYDENINAVYLNFNTQTQKVNYQFGLRVEHTKAKGIQKVSGETFDRNYVQLFPSLALNYDASKNHTWGLTLSRRIDRPSYRQLNPFKFFLDPTTYQEGNPFLLPQLTYSAEIAHTFNKTYTISVSYSKTRDLIGDALLQNDAERITIQKTLNIAESNNYGIEISIPKQITKKWNTNTTFNAFYNDFKGIVANAPLNNGKPTFQIVSVNSFVLSKGFTLETTVNYLHNQAYTVSYLLPFFNCAVGIQKPIWERKGTLRLNFNDIFYRYYPRGGTRFANINESFTSYRDTRTVNLTFTYRFGKNTVPQVRRRAGGADEEKRRVGAGS